MRITIAQANLVIVCGLVDRRVEIDAQVDAQYFCIWGINIFGQRHMAERMRVYPDIAVAVKFTAVGPVVVIVTGRLAGVNL